MCTVLFLLVTILSVSDQLPAQPNIVLIVADDLGYNDVGWHNSDMVTPNLDTLATTGVRKQRISTETRPHCNNVKAPTNLNLILVDINLWLVLLM